MFLAPFFNLGFFSYLGSRDKLFFFAIELSLVDLTRNDPTLVLIYLWGRFSKIGRSALSMAYIGLNRIFTKNREKSKKFIKFFTDS